MERAELRKLAFETGAAVEKNGFVFLRDPHLPLAEKLRFEELLAQLPPESEASRGWLCIATGGSGGGLKFARHDEDTLAAAAQGFAAHFRCNHVNALDVLPAHHVSGFMSRIRCAETGGRHVTWSWKALEAGDWPQLAAEKDGWFLSVVPTQLQRLLVSRVSVEKLRQFTAVFVGGGPLWPELARAAREAKVPISICYGMTETAAMVTAQQPADFLAGDQSCGMPLPHAKLSIVDEQTGALVSPGEAGLVCVEGASICRGFFPPQTGMDGRVQTEDLGLFNRSKGLEIIGRRDAMIITGGKKVHPGEVEAVLRRLEGIGDIAVVGIEDPQWGSAVVACYPRGTQIPDTERLQSVLSQLASYQRPKHWVSLDPWPRTPQGKLNRALLIEKATRAIRGS
jgi:O-succinylbenzoic acid--CoA ligase